MNLKNEEDIVGKLREIARKINEGRKRKHLNARHIKEVLNEQYKEKAKRSGIKT